MNTKKLLALDLGGTFFKYALVSDDGTLSEKGKVPTPQYPKSTKDDFFTAIDSIVSPVRDRISGIAVSAPGILDDTDGFMHTAGALMYLQGTALGTALSERYSLPVSVENDGKCAALAEYRSGALKGCKNCAVLILGTGIGGGLIIDGKLHRGKHGSAGEYSFVMENPRSAIAEKGGATWAGSCGNVPFLELVASKTGEKAEDLNGEIIFARAEKGEKAVVEAVHEFTRALAGHLFNLNMLLDLDAIAIGGGISASNLLIEYLKNDIDEIMNIPPAIYMNGGLPKPVVTVCAYRADANLLGAYYHYCSQIEQK